MPGLRETLEAATPLTSELSTHAEIDAAVRALEQLEEIAPELAALVLDMGEALREHECPNDRYDDSGPDCAVCPLLARLDRIGKEQR